MAEINISKAVSANQFALGSGAANVLYSGSATGVMERIVIENQSAITAALLHLINSSDTAPAVSEIQAGTARTWTLQPGQVLDETVSGPVSIVGCTGSGTANVSVRVVR